MHPNRDVLRRYCDGRTDSGESERIAVHLELCEFCQEYCREFRSLSRHIEAAMQTHVPGSQDALADRLHRMAQSGITIRLVAAESEAVEEAALLAADGGGTVVPRLENLGTLYSEEPEVILRLMRDNVHDREYLQLVSEDDHLISGVLVQVPDLDLNLLTDQDGRAELDWRRIKDLVKHQWRVKLPDAEFSLAPFEYDPERVEYRQETILETERGDRVGIRFEGRTEDKRLSVRILQLGGRSEFGTVHVAVTQGREAIARRLSDQDELHMDLTSPQDTIAIRLFADSL